MFRFDAFKKPVANRNEQDPLSSSLPTINFLQRITSSDSETRSLFEERPSTMAKSVSTSSSSNSSYNKMNTASFSIPMPINSWGMLALSRLQDIQENDLDDIVNLLLNKNEAILLLPVSTPSHPSALVDRAFIMDHIILCNDTNQIISLGGVRGMFKKDQLVVLGLLPPSDDDISRLVDNSTTKNPLFDTFSLDPSSITSDHPKYNILASHVQLPLRDDKLIRVMLIQKPLLRKDIVEWTEAKAKNIKDISTPLNDACSIKVDQFIKNYKKNPPKTTDLSSSRILDFIDDLREADVHDDTGRLDNIESYICSQLYDQLFTNPEGDEAMQDEALENRIAALNLLDLNLQHLGVKIESEQDNKRLTQIVKGAGTQLQQLHTIMGAKEKLEALVKTHEIIVNAIEEFAEKHRHTTRLDSNAEVVQELKQAISSVEEEDEKPISSVNADVLLPILIFTIVKSNPTNFLSNLKFIQRYRRPEVLSSGQTSYCLTNMMAAVSFLETTNLVGLGLSVDRVFSHVTDLSTTKVTENVPKQEQQPITGLKIVSDVVDSSYRVFDGLGKFWQRNTQELENKTVSGLVGQVKGRVRKASDAALPKSEMKEMSTASTSSSVSSLPSFMEDRTNSRTKKNTPPSLLSNGDGPIAKFLDMKSVDELKIGEITELLADYKRLAAIIKQANLA